MKKNIAVIMGGYSSEVTISIKSGNVVHQHIDLEKYIPYQVHILERSLGCIRQKQHNTLLTKMIFLPTSMEIK